MTPTRQGAAGGKPRAPLLVIDGDSFAHRAFHALPRSIRRANGAPGNLLTGLTSMVLRLWQAERPRAVVVGWDTLTVPTYRHELLPGYQAGRVFDPELLEQLDLAPGLLEAAGIVCGKAAGYEADDFLAAAVAAERKAGGTALVATSDRDAFQLVADDVTILQPVRGVSELARIGPAEVRDRVPPYTLATQPAFRECECCRRVFWAGSHARGILRRLQPFLRDPGG